MQCHARHGRNRNEMASKAKGQGLSNSHIDAGHHRHSRAVAAAPNLRELPRRGNWAFGPTVRVDIGAASCRAKSQSHICKTACDQHRQPAAWSLQLFGSIVDSSSRNSSSSPRYMIAQVILSIHNFQHLIGLMSDRLHQRLQRILAIFYLFDFTPQRHELQRINRSDWIRRQWR